MTDFSRMRKKHTIGAATHTHTHLYKNQRYLFNILKKVQNGHKWLHGIEHIIITHHYYREP